MTSGTCIWAVALDVDDDDLVYADGRVLDPENDDEKARSVVFDLSSAHDTSRDVTHAGPMRVRATDSAVLVWVPIQERDNLGRETGALVLLPRDALAESGWVDSAVDEIATVLESSGRTLARFQLREALTRAGIRLRQSPLQLLLAYMRWLIHIFRQLLDFVRSKATLPREPRE